MGLQVSRRLGPADGVTLVNAVVGFVAGVVAVSAPHLAARLILAAAVVDALDGIVARSARASRVGSLLDSITDVVSFGTAPGLFVYGAFRVQHGGVGTMPTWLLAVVLGAGSAFVCFSILRTAFYEEFVDPGENRPGIPNALAAVILAAAYLAGLRSGALLLGGTVVLSVLMVAPVRYPKLAARDALGMGVVQVLAIAVPGVYGGIFPSLLLGAALAYLVLGPRYYWNGDPD